MTKINFHLPINGLSFGQCSTLLLRTLFDQEKAGTSTIESTLFPIGPVDLSSQTNLPPDFKQWLESKIRTGLETHSRQIPTFKLWHLNGSIESLSEKQSLFSFYELDAPTKAEINVARNNKTYFSSKYTCKIFEEAGVKTEYLPLAFDSYNFSVKGKKYFNDERIVFNLLGKFEKRKGHAKVISAWIKKFGNNPKFSLQCALVNPFLSDQQNQQIIAQLVNNNKPFNVSFYPKMQEDSVYNDFLNSADVVLSLSGGEGFGLGEFHSIAMGKHAVLLKAHVYPDWATDEMVTWVNPNGKEPAYDGMFFQQGGMFNQGNIFTFNEDEFIAGCENAIRRVEKCRINDAGLKLQHVFSKEKLLENVIKSINI